MRDKLLYAFLGFVLCLCIGIGGKLAAGGLKRIKTPLQRQAMLAKHEKGLTLD